jgi:hypothetical protein
MMIFCLVSLAPDSHQMLKYKQVQSTAIYARLDLGLRQSNNAGATDYRLRTTGGPSISSRRSASSRRDIPATWAAASE